jgi:hypothetical protein
MIGAIQSQAQPSFQSITCLVTSSAYVKMIWPPAAFS